MTSNNKSLKSKVLYGLFWRFMESSGTQGIQFVVSIILARLLLPKDFGIIGLITVYIQVANVFIQSGFGTALIQKKEVDDEDYSSVFYLSLTMSAVLYLILYFTAPLIARFYSEPMLVQILRILSFTLILGVINSIQFTVISREMKFKKSFIVSLGGVFVSALVGVTMAYRGYGIWSLVFSQISGQVTSTIILWFTVRWRPKLLFSFKKIKELFKFGSNLLISGLLDSLFNNLFPLIIGKLFGSTMLGYYNRGQSFPSLMVNNIDGTIVGVMFPALSKFQNDRVQVKKIVRRMLVTSSFLVIPMMVGLAVVARPLVLLLLTDKWLPCVPFLQFACITYALWPIFTANLQAITAVGRSDIFLRLEIFKKILLVVVILISVHYGIYAMLIGSVIVSFVSAVINASPNKKLLNYSYKEQMFDIMPSILLSLTMSLVVLAVSLLSFSLWLVFLLQIIVGAVFYFGVAYLLKFECFLYILDLLKAAIDKNFKQKRTNNFSE
ncbi:MAG TPA: lipopolysaccharide biosynthesis protein [Clostridium sp.]|uniref:lipopolysaccharide biosynthesis protein n=1 Tax=Clostridium sp. TaxID=1506 RepID=UPI002F92B9BC